MEQEQRKKDNGKGILIGTGFLLFMGIVLVMLVLMFMYTSRMSGESIEGTEEASPLAAVELEGVFSEEELESSTTDFLTRKVSYTLRDGTTVEEESREEGMDVLRDLHPEDEDLPPAQNPIVKSTANFLEGTVTYELADGQTFEYGLHEKNHEAMHAAVYGE